MGRMKMPVAKVKTKILSFRMTGEEYKRLELAAAAQARHPHDLARSLVLGSIKLWAAKDEDA